MQYRLSHEVLGDRHVENKSVRPRINWKNKTRLQALNRSKKRGEEKLAEGMKVK